MVGIELPFHPLFVCEICGHSSYNRGVIEECEARGTSEKPDVQRGDRVEIYVQAWQDDGFTGMTPAPEEFAVYSLYYSRPREVIDFFDSIEPHTLCVTLRQSLSKKAWSPEDSGWSEKTLTYHDFLLWRKGNREKFEVTGLVKPPGPKKKR